MKNKRLIRGGYFLPIIMFLGLLIFVFFGLKTSSVNPPFQGPDEIAHYARLMAVPSSCGRLPPPMIDIWNRVKPLIYHPENKLSLEQIELLESIPAKDQNNGDTSHWIIIGDGACAYSSAYVWPLQFLIKFIPKSVTMINWVLQIRNFVFVLSAILWFTAGILCLWGRPLFKLSPLSLFISRATCLWSLTILMLLPQVLWISQTLSTDYLLIPMGSLMALHFFFRIRIFSEFIFLLAIAFSTLKPLYLPLWSAVLLSHYLILGAQHRKILFIIKNNKWLTGLLVTLGSFILLGYHTNNALQPYLITFKNKGSLGLPHYFFNGTAFAQFGWLDSWLAPNSLRLMLFPLSCLFLWALLQFIVNILTRRKPNFLWFDRLIALSTLFFGLLAFISLGIALKVLADWCQVKHGYNTIGCGYQKRYELPFYSLFLTFYILLILRFLFQSFGHKKTKITLLCLLLGLQIAVNFVVLDRMYVLLKTRYFKNETASNKYGQIYWKSWKTFW